MSLQFVTADSCRLRLGLCFVWAKQDSTQTQFFVDTARQIQVELPLLYLTLEMATPSHASHTMKRRNRWKRGPTKSCLLSMTKPVRSCRVLKGHCLGIPIHVFLNNSACQRKRSSLSSNTCTCCRRCLVGIMHPISKTEKTHTTRALYPLVVVVATKSSRAKGQRFGMDGMPPLWQWLTRRPIVFFFPVPSGGRSNGEGFYAHTKAFHVKPG